MHHTDKKVNPCLDGGGMEVILDGILFIVSMFLKEKTGWQKKD